MSDRARTLADDFAQANGDLIQLVEELSDAEWATRTDAEAWSVAITARHVAAAHAFIARRVKAVAESQPLPPMPPGGIDAENARDAERYANVTRDEVLALLRTNGADAAALVRALADEQLDRQFSRPNGDTMTLVALIQNALIGHLAAHSTSMRAAVGR
jgi:uncharacterized damage-inducible protein DinB